MFTSMKNLVNGGCRRVSQQATQESSLRAHQDGSNRQESSLSAAHQDGSNRQESSLLAKCNDGSNRHKTNRTGGWSNLRVLKALILAALIQVSWGMQAEKELKGTFDINVNGENFTQKLFGNEVGFKKFFESPEAHANTIPKISADGIYTITGSGWYIFSGFRTNEKMLPGVVPDFEANKDFKDAGIIKTTTLEKMIAGISKADTFICTRAGKLSEEELQKKKGTTTAWLRTLSDELKTTQITVIRTVKNKNDETMKPSWAGKLADDKGVHSVIDVGSGKVALTFPTGLQDPQFAVDLKKGNGTEYGKWDGFEEYFTRIREEYTGKIIIARLTGDYRNKKAHEADAIIELCRKVNINDAAVLPQEDEARLMSEHALSIVRECFPKVNTFALFELGGGSHQGALCTKGIEYNVKARLNVTVRGRNDKAFKTAIITIRDNYKRKINIQFLNDDGTVIYNRERIVKRVYNTEKGYKLILEKDGMSIGATNLYMKESGVSQFTPGLFELLEELGYKSFTVKQRLSVTRATGFFSGGFYAQKKFKKYKKSTIEIINNGNAKKPYMQLRITEEGSTKPFIRKLKSIRISGDSTKGYKMQLGKLNWSLAGTDRYILPCDDELTGNQKGLEDFLALLKLKGYIRKTCDRSADNAGECKAVVKHGAQKCVKNHAQKKSAATAVVEETMQLQANHSNRRIAIFAKPISLVQETNSSMTSKTSKPATRTRAYSFGGNPTRSTRQIRPRSSSVGNPRSTLPGQKPAATSNKVPAAIGKDEPVAAVPQRWGCEPARMYTCDGSYGAEFFCAQTDLTADEIRQGHTGLGSEKCGNAITDPTQYKVTRRRHSRRLATRRRRLENRPIHRLLREIRRAQA